MSSKQSDRHIIWSDIHLDFNDWRGDLAQQYPDLSEDELIQKMYEINADYLTDERANLNIQLSQPIIVIGDIGRWNGRVLMRFICFSGMNTAQTSSLPFGSG